MSDDREMSVAASIASVTVAMFNARHHALMRGETDDSLAKRIGLNVREWRDKFLRPEVLAIDALSDIFYACECDPVMSLRDARAPDPSPTEERGNGRERRSTTSRASPKELPSNERLR